LRATATATALVMAVAACAGPAGMSADGRPLTPAEIQMRAEADQFNETVAGGAATGALVGAVLGALLGATSRDRGAIARGAAIGAVGGGVLGGMDGYMTAKRQEASRNQVRVIDAVTRDVQADNQRLQGLVASSTKVLEDGRARLAQLSQEARTNAAARDQLRRERVELQQNAKAVQTSIDALRQRQRSYAEAAGRSGQSSANLDQEIGRLDRQIGQLEANLQGMNSALSLSPA
jgi:hypothetical protein